MGWLGDLAIDGVGRTAFGDPGRAKIGQFGLEAFDLEAERGAAGKRECNYASRLIGLLEDDGKQVQNLILFHGRAIALRRYAFALSR